MNLDFERRGARFEETCVATVALPEWRVARVATGQLAGDGKLWEVEFLIGDVETDHAPVSHPEIEGEQ